MNYMLLIYEAPDAWSTLSEAEQNQAMGDYFAFTQEIADRGELVSGEALQGLDTATTVTVRAGDTIVTDGPFAETKEVLGGYYLVKVDTLERAHELAAKIPGARTGKVEVRPIMEFPQD
jgi:hypothetical protein